MPAAREHQPAAMCLEFAEESHLKSEPVWDEVAGCFWCPTSINAYDIPDGIPWQRNFQDTLLAMEPSFFEPQIPDDEAVHLDLMPPAHTSFFGIGSEHRVASPSKIEYGTTGCSDATPPSPRTPPVRKQPKWARESPRCQPLTPPLIQLKMPDTRRLRAAHTKALANMKEKAGTPVIVQGREVALFRLGGQLFAVNARCPHQGGNLCEGEVGDIEDLSMEGSSPFVTCPVHKMQFNLRDGSVIKGKCSPLQTYRVRVSEVDHQKRVAMIQVGFNALADTYFDEVDF